jgi:hypothetical protein
MEDSDFELLSLDFSLPEDLSLPAVFSLVDDFSSLDFELDERPCPDGERWSVE